MFTYYIFIYTIYRPTHTLIYNFIDKSAHAHANLLKLNGLTGPMIKFKFISVIDMRQEQALTE